MDQGGRTAIVGGASRLGATLLDGPFAGAVPVLRKAGGRGEGIHVASYAAVTADHLRGFDTVINCTGLIEGTAADLRAANIVLPVRLADAARRAGVRRFIHISSFSVHGGATRIDPTAPELPETAYGRSKLAGDWALQALDDADFSVVSLRLPALIGAGAGVGAGAGGGAGGGRDKLGRLLRVWRRMRVLPCPARPVRRSMISLTLAARVLATLCRADGEDGAGEARAGTIRYAADPEPFTFAQAAKAIAAAGGPGVRALAVPGVALAPARLFAPALHRSLWQDSMLCPHANLATGMPSDLYATIAEIAR